MLPMWPKTNSSVWGFFVSVLAAALLHQWESSGVILLRENFPGGHLQFVCTDLWRWWNCRAELLSETSSYVILMETCQASMCFLFFVFFKTTRSNLKLVSFLWRFEVESPLFDSQHLHDVHFGTQQQDAAGLLPLSERPQWERGHSTSPYYNTVSNTLCMFIRLVHGITYLTDTVCNVVTVQYRRHS